MGGAIYASGSKQLTIHDNIYFNNYAVREGQIIYIRDSSNGDNNVTAYNEIFWNDNSNEDYIVGNVGSLENNVSRDPVGASNGILAIAETRTDPELYLTENYSIVVGNSKCFYPNNNIPKLSDIPCSFTCNAWGKIILTQEMLLEGAVDKDNDTLTASDLNSKWQMHHYN